MTSFTCDLMRAVEMDSQAQLGLIAANNVISVQMAQDSQIFAVDMYERICMRVGIYMTGYV